MSTLIYISFAGICSFLCLLHFHESFGSSCNVSALNNSRRQIRAHRLCFESGRTVVLIYIILICVLFFLLQACAPRYVYYIFMDRMDPVGMCFTARNNFRQIRAHRPCVESGRTVVSNLHYINFLFLFPSTPVCSCPFLSVINKKNPLVKLGLRTKICVVLAKF